VASRRRRTNQPIDDQPARGLSTRIVGPPSAYRAANPKVAEACLQPQQPDRFAYRQFPFMAADIWAAAIGGSLARRDAPNRHGEVALLDALGQRDFARAWGHALQARSGRAAGKARARNVHGRLAPRNPLPVILHSVLTATRVTGDLRPRTCIRLQPGCVRVVDNERQNARIQSMALDRFTYDAKL
jgi:hypothetical protein